MALRNLRTGDDSILRMKSKEVVEINDRIKTLIDDMLDTMYHNNGVGLAAPQVGILKRIVVIDVGEGPIVMVNPRIISSDGEQIDIEGCLSIPGVFGEVSRPSYVVAEAMDRNGKKIRVEGSDMLARAICHETDHLDGILFTDRVIRYVEQEELEKKRKKSD